MFLQQPQSSLRSDGVANAAQIGRHERHDQTREYAAKATEYRVQEERQLRAGANLAPRVPDPFRTPIADENRRVIQRTATGSALHLQCTYEVKWPA